MIEKMHNDPKVSIVTIVLNQKKHLQRAIDSVIHQTYKNIEHIIIDGGSTDGTIDVIKRNENDIHYWISEKDHGISDAFNKGIGKSRGSILGILNADDWYEKDVIEHAVKTIGDYDIVYGNLNYWESEKKTLVEANHKLLSREMTINHPAVFVRKDAYDKYGVFLEEFRYAMDYELMLRMLVRGAKFIYDPKIVVNMQSSGESDQHWIKGCEEVKKAKQMHLGKSIWHNLWFYKQVLAIGGFKTMKRIGFGALVNFYRSNFATIKREQLTK